MSYINHYEDFKDKVFSYFYYNLNKNRELAEDLTSETFLKWFDKFDSYNPDYKFSTWIFTIARNTLTDYFRKNKVDISLDEIGEIDYTEFLKYEQDFDRKIDNEDILLEAQDAIWKLPLVQKDIIIMKYLSEFSTKEISSITWKTEVNIRKIISRWLKKIFKTLNSKNITYEKF